MLLLVVQYFEYLKKNRGKFPFIKLIVTYLAKYRHYRALIKHLLQTDRRHMTYKVGYRGGSPT